MDDFIHLIMQLQFTVYSISMYDFIHSTSMYAGWWFQLPRKICSPLRIIVPFLWFKTVQHEQYLKPPSSCIFSSPQNIHSKLRAEKKTPPNIHIYSTSSISPRNSKVQGPKKEIAIHGPRLPRGALHQALVFVQLLLPLGLAPSKNLFGLHLAVANRLLYLVAGDWSSSPPKIPKWRVQSWQKCEVECSLMGVG